MYEEGSIELADARRNLGRLTKSDYGLGFEHGVQWARERAEGIARRKGETFKTPMPRAACLEIAGAIAGITAPISPNLAPGGEDGGDIAPE